MWGAGRIREGCGLSWRVVGNGGGQVAGVGHGAACGTCVVLVLEVCLACRAAGCDVRHGITVWRITVGPRPCSLACTCIGAVLCHVYMCACVWATSDVCSDAVARTK